MNADKESANAVNFDHGYVVRDEIGGVEVARTRRNRTVTAKPWFTVGELAIYYGVSIATVRMWIKTGKLNTGNGAHRMGNNWRINRSEFESKFMDARKG